MITQPNECYAYFTVTGEFNPADITARLTLQPTISWMKGDRNERTHLERKFSRWSLHSRLNHTTTMEQHVEDVLEQMAPASEAIIELLKTVEGVMQLVGHFHSDYPGLHFAASTLRNLARFNLDLDMDFYYLYSDKREDS